MKSLKEFVGVVDEEEKNFLPEPPQEDDTPAVSLYIDDNDNMRIQLSAFYHGPHNGKIPLLKDNPVLQELVMKAIQMEAQKAFQIAVHSVLGKPYGLPENKKNKQMTNETKLWQLRAGLITEGEYQEAIDMEEAMPAPAATPAAPAQAQGLGDQKPATTTTGLAQKLINVVKQLRTDTEYAKKLSPTEITQLDLLINKLLGVAADPANNTPGMRAVQSFTTSKFKA